MNLTDSIAPKSDQLDAIELVSGPRTFTIEKVSANSPDQPFNFHLKELDRVWRPGKSMRRVIVAAWGAEASAYVGQQVTLYCDPTVRFGNDITGGTRISHMTGIDKPLKVSLMVSRGKFSMFTVLPLEKPSAPSQADTTGRDWIAELELAGYNLDAVTALGTAAIAAHAPFTIVEQMRARRDELKAQQ